MQTTNNYDDNVGIDDDDDQIDNSKDEVVNDVDIEDKDKMTNNNNNNKEIGNVMNAGAWSNEEHRQCANSLLTHGHCTSYERMHKFVKTCTLKQIKGYIIEHIKLNYYVIAQNTWKLLLVLMVLLKV